VALASAGLVGLTAGPASAQTCGLPGPNRTQLRVNNNFRTNGVNIRTGPSTNCTSVGQGQATHDTVLHCFRIGTDGFIWTHLFDLDTGRQGYVRSDLLFVNSGNPC
jgi:hypothetical protein